MSMMGLSDLDQKKQGLVHLYVGDGKGKTTAATGLAARMLGSGRKVLFCQFLKGRDTGEIESLKALGAEICRAPCGEKFFFQLCEEEKQTLSESHCACLAHAAAEGAAGSYQMIVLDEVVDAVNCGAVELDALLRLLEARHPSVEVVLTGRNPDPRLIEFVDYYTEFICRRHPYQKGISSRPGVEY